VAAHFDPAKFESLDREAQGQIMGVKYYNPSITKYNQDAPQDTIRDVTGARFTGPGQVEPVVKGQTDYCTGLQLLKEAKRGSYVNTTRVQWTGGYSTLPFALLNHASNLVWVLHGWCGVWYPEIFWRLLRCWLPDHVWIVFEHTLRQLEIVAWVGVARVLFPIGGKLTDLRRGAGVPRRV
jgi:hypothetical protein